ncbi:hypothetical protein L2E82_01540 [Cichorium intybus]|uniref:Uncharacterized protein n=1 Tax=Cichorium intybus TaxID=13427 RepID=A0ACB9H0Q9_CICIN|nr:hypothetical protein L2E82_01540 [Cichorium intybus]
MKEVGRSVHSVDVVKKKSSSGCLIIKKKVADGVRGVHVSESLSRKLYYSTNEKKRPRVIRSDSESSDEFTEPYRQQADRFHNGSSYSNRGFMENRESETERKVTSRIHVNQFDEYNGFHERMNRKDANDHRHGVKLHWQGGDPNNSASGSSRKFEDKRREFLHDNRNTILGGKSNRPTHGIKSGYKMEDNKSHLPLKYREVSNEPIRLQGKNGVLKVMVNKHKQMSVPHQSYDPVEVEKWKESRPEVYKKKQHNMSHKSHDHWEGPIRKKPAMEPSLYSASRHPEKPVSFKSKEKVEVDLDLEKPVLDDSDTSLPIKPIKPSSVRHLSTEKMVKSDKRLTPQTKKVTPVKVKETKVKRGSGTEKQLLREKIRSMLLSAGWTIDYRPRRNRDYLDAVYINPTGTAYWSIIKAYEALQKEGQDHSQIGGEFTPLPVETLSKLTRQTRKKMEREMKKKKREEGNSGDDSNDNYSKERVAKRSIGHDSDTLQGQKSRKLGRCILLVRSEGKKSSENDRFVSYSGKRTLLSWLIDSGTVETSEKVQYMNRRQTHVMQEGWITKDGIHCGCCSKILTVLKFELHAGSKLRQPYLNIFGQSGKSLMQCQIDAWNKQGELERKGFYSVDVDGDDPNDDTCGLCGDGGDLICCDGCPSTFHQSCLGIKMLPQGDWHCPNCSCKYCEMAYMNSTEGGVRSESPLFKCCLCEKKYHESCSLEMDEKTMGPTDPNLSFCGQKCLQLHSDLQKLVGVKHELGSGFSWSLIHRTDLPSDASSMELSQRVECNSKLAVALSVIDECFIPVLDRRSGINLIHNVVYNCGSNLSRLNYSGFLTAILERGDEMICAASIRIHGTQLAEMPFIGTRHMYRRQGMCRRLLSAIESALSSLHIEKLIIPAIAEHMHTWTGVFGFNSLKESHKQEMRSMNMLVFPGTDMLQKPLIPGKSSPLDKTRIKPESNIPKAERSESRSPDVKEPRQKIAHSDSGSQDANGATLSIGSVKNTIQIPVPTRKSEVFCDSDVHFDGDDTIMQNGEEGSEVFANSDAIPAKKALQDGNETNNRIADSNCKVEGSALQNGNVTSATKTSGSGLFPPKDHVFSSANTKELAGNGSVSVSTDSDSDSDSSTDSDSDEELIDVQNGESADAIPIESHVLNKTISLDIHEPEPSGMESLPAANIAELVQFSTEKEK